MSAEITNLTVRSGDITQLNVTSSDITSVSIQTNDVSVISTVPATINLASLSFASEIDLPSDIAREASAGVSLIAARADHIHSLANTMLDGGNY